MNIFFTSDTHFSHHNIIEYDERPFKNVEDMNNEIATQWIERIDPSDIVYHLGDFGMGSTEKLHKIIDRLTGNITLIRGNHDGSLKKLLEIGFVCVADELTLKYKGFIFILSHEANLAYKDVEGVINIHGHSHSSERFNKNFINVCTSVWDYAPVSLEDMLIDYKKNKKKII